jgi:hypothetical protein
MTEAILDFGFGLLSLAGNPPIKPSDFGFWIKCIFWFQAPSFNKVPLASLAEANVGIFHTASQPAIVPDVFVSLDVQIPENWWDKQNRSYLVWQFGKPPEVVIEIVSNKVGDELGNKLKIYEKMRVSYYVVYDPTHQLGEQVLLVYELRGTRYSQTPETWLEQVGLGVTLWTGEFEGRHDSWLRWCYEDGSVLLTGDERARQLAERLRAMGIDPDNLR